MSNVTRNAKQSQNKIKILVQEFFCKFDTRIIEVNINKIKCCGKMLLFIILEEKASQRYCRDLFR